MRLSLSIPTRNLHTLHRPLLPFPSPSRPSSNGKNISNELHNKQIALRRGLQALLRIFVFRSATLRFRGGVCGGASGREDAVFFKEGDGLHGGDAGEDVEEMGMLGGWNAAEEEEFVHFFFGGGCN